MPIAENDKRFARSVLNNHFIVGVGCSFKLSKKHTMVRLLKY